MSHPQELLERLQKRVGGRGVSQILYWSKLHPFDATSFFCSEPSFGNLCPKVQLHILLSLINGWQSMILLYCFSRRARVSVFARILKETDNHQTLNTKRFHRKIMKIFIFVLCLAIWNAKGLPTKEAFDPEDSVLFATPRSGNIYNRSEGENLVCLNADSLGYAMAFKLRIKNMEI